VARRARALITPVGTERAAILLKTRAFHKIFDNLLITFASARHRRVTFS
jgi:hypothetical protein